MSPTTILLQTKMKRNTGWGLLDNKTTSKNLIGNKYFRQLMTKQNSPVCMKLMINLSTVRNITVMTNYICL